MTLPHGWWYATIGELVDASVEQRAPDRAMTYIDIGSIDRASKRVASPQVIQPDAAPSRARQRLREGDVLVSLTRPNLNAVAKITHDFRDSIASTGFDVLRAQAVNPDWLYYRVMQQDFVEDVCSGIQGVVYPAIRPADVRRHILPVPPKEEQLRIVGALDDHLSRLDAATGSLHDALAKLQAYRASVLKAAVEGRLVPTEATLARAEQREYESADVLLQRILVERQRRWEETELNRLIASGMRPKNDKWKSKYVEPAALDARSLPQLPSGWTWATLDQLTSKITSGSRDWTPYYGQGTGVFIMAQNVRPGQLDLSFRQLVDAPSSDSSTERARVTKGDLLVTIVGANTGQVCFVDRELRDYYVCQSVALMRPVDASLTTYISAVLNSPGGQRTFAAFMYGQGRPHLSFDQLRVTPIPLPPLAEQVRIVSQLDALQSIAAHTASTVEVENGRAALLRQSILKWAFEGKLVDQDSTDDRAEKLLEHISTKRAAQTPVKAAVVRRAKKTAK